MSSEISRSYENTYSPVFSRFTDVLQEMAQEEQPMGSKTAYLTFDDGPSPRTDEILDVLSRHGIKATFFVVVNKDEYIPYMIRAVNEGHTIGVHSAMPVIHRLYFVFREEV